MFRMQSAGDADPRSILVVLPTWVGDFVMATPTLRAVRSRFPDARITFLGESNLRELIRGGDWMDKVIEWPPKAQRSVWHRSFRSLVRELRERGFDWAILLSNSFRAAMIARLAGATRRIGYHRDGRGFLLTDRVPVKNRRGGGTSANLFGKGTSVCLSNPDRRSIPSSSCLQQMALASGKKVAPASVPEFGHANESQAGRDAGSTISQTEPCASGSDRGGLRLTNLPLPHGYKGKYQPMPLVEYYADLAEAIGCERPGDLLELFTTPDCDKSMNEKLAAKGVDGSAPLIVLSPGAKYGASKCWFPERFAAVADRLVEKRQATVVVTCGPGEEAIAQAIGGAMQHEGIVLDKPFLSLGELKSLIRQADLQICNDAGPRHFAKAFDVPVVTVFGPTHPDWTATSHPAERIVRIDIECGPCQERVCPLGHLDCMKGVTVDAVYEAACELLDARVAAKATEPVHD